MNRVDRRQFVKAVCATGGSVGLVACLSDERTQPASSTPAESSGEETERDNESERDEETERETVDEAPPELPDNGAVVFVYDDGPVEDLTQAFPAHQEFDAPATTGIVSNWIGREDFMDNDWMDVDHLETLTDAGWELASHTTFHGALATADLVEDAEPTATRVYPSSPHHGYFRNRELEITDGDDAVRRTVVDAGEDAVGRYIELDEELGVSFAADETVERYPADVMDALLGDSKRELESLGFEIDTLLAPYDRFDEWALEFAEKYYDGIANARPKSRINEPDGFDPYWTRRDYFIEFTTPDAVERDLDVVAEKGVLGVLGAHTFKDEVDEEGIRRTLEWVDERDIEVLTLRDAIPKMTA